MNDDSATSEQEQSAEAARYALLRRLLPVLRHHLVVHLQPIGMIYEVLDRKLAGERPELGPVREGLAKINMLSRSALGACLDVVTWMAPDPSVSTEFRAGVGECVDLLRSNFMFRGYGITSEVDAVMAHVQLAALREVLTAALIATADALDKPCDLVLQARTEGADIHVSIRVSPGSGTGFSTEMAYRALRWTDVAALAHAHSVTLQREASGVQLTFRASA